MTSEQKFDLSYKNANTKVDQINKKMKNFFGIPHN
jgi:hypothetical protein